MNKYRERQRQYRWSNNTYNKLLEIKPILGEWKQSFRKSQKEEVVLSRLRIGHVRITHSCLLEEEKPMCYPCQTAYTIKHVFIECIGLASTREHFTTQVVWKNNFLKNKVDAIKSFLKAMGLHEKI